MTPFEQEYYLELCSRITDEFDSTFISFEERELENPDNLVAQLHSSEYPLVLCAFLESAKYEADDTFVPFREITPPTMEEVEEFLVDYKKMPTCLTISSHAISNEYLWEGIQYSRFYVHTQHFKHLYYALTFNNSGKFLHGKGEIPVATYGEIYLEEVKMID